MKDKTVAGILAIFLGHIGVHRFYLNQSGLGVLYIFLTIITCGLFAIVGLIDGIIILMMDDHNFDLKYNPDKIQREILAQVQQKETIRQEVRPEADPRHAYEPDPAAQRRQAVKQQRKVQKENKYKVTGIRKFRDYDFIGAKEDFLKALEISKDDIAVHFNLSCCYSMEEDIEKSLTHLSRSVKLGFKDFDKIHKHDSLAFLRAHDEFDDFVKNKYQWDGDLDEDTKTLDAPKEDILSQTIEIQEEEETPSFDLLDQLNHQKEKILLTEEPQEQEKKFNDFLANTSSPNLNSTTNDSVSDELLQKLKQLGELKEKGILNEEEFQEQKKRLLG